MPQHMHRHTSMHPTAWPGVQIGVLIAVTLILYILQPVESETAALVLGSIVPSAKTDMLSQEAMTGSTVQHTECVFVCVSMQMASHHLREAEISRVYGLR